MVTHLADALIERYVLTPGHVLDPFCGSGAILRAAADRGCAVSGIDINPYATLMSKVKLEGFDCKRAMSLCDEVVESAKASGRGLLIDWSNKQYWFTAATLRKFEQFRFAAAERQLYRSRIGRAVLLALGLSVRLCSKADQRSPKPFISKQARLSRHGVHFCPYWQVKAILQELSCRLLPTGVRARIVTGDARSRSDVSSGAVTHIVTSPPYANAQDYFRNCKLELYVLESLLPFAVKDIKLCFVGTERGVNLQSLEGEVERWMEVLPELAYLIKCRPFQALVLTRYLKDMELVFSNAARALASDGTFVVVCGDNLIGGRRILTWRLLNVMLEQLGFALIDQYGDRIKKRSVAPKRCGHRGIIKSEQISAFRRLR